MNIIPVNKVGHGTDTTLPSTLVLVNTAKYSGFVFTNIDNPEKNEPSPKAIKAKAGIANPPTKSPTPLMVSLTATDFNPPKIAYALPSDPIVATTSQRGIFKSNIPIIAKEPV